MSRIDEIAPARLLVTADGKARVRVTGRCHGFVRVGRERRWVWGRFDESFSVEPSAEQQTIRVAVVGIGGRAERELRAEPAIDLRTPAVRTAVPAARVEVPVPRLRRLWARRISLPRVVRLQRAPIQSERRDTESST